jgi:hypothetical protein
MIPASLKMVVLLLALVAGGFAMRDAASASGGVPPCHATLAGHDASQDASSVADSVAVVVLAVADASSSVPHHHGSGRGCPTDGSCCDAFCHAVMAASVPDAATIDVTFASYVRSDDATEASLPVMGPERPPRTAAI